MKLSLIAAVAENRVIGNRGSLPWQLPDELKRLKRLTTGHCLLMGRRTFEAIGRPLPGRTSIVLTRDPSFAPDGIVRVGDFEEALATAAARGEEELFVFGGASLYELSLPRADRLYLTRVHASVEGDTLFPEFDLASWKLVSQETHAADERHAVAFTFEVYDRVRRR